MTDALPVKDKNDFKEAVKYAAQMLNELRTGWLSPKTYYELYLKIFSHLSFLEVYFTQLQRGGMPMSELYVSVQHAGTVLVRLYLLVTAGSAYLKSGQVRAFAGRVSPPAVAVLPVRRPLQIGAKDLLNDLMDMVKGVQHPQRALFLRYYLHQKIKGPCGGPASTPLESRARLPAPPPPPRAADKLPDVGTAYEGAGGNVRDAVDVIIRNFGEMNRLWIRMQVRGRARGGGGASVAGAPRSCPLRAKGNLPCGHDYLHLRPAPLYPERELRGARARSGARGSGRSCACSWPRP